MCCFVVNTDLNPPSAGSLSVTGLVSGAEDLRFKTRVVQIGHRIALTTFNCPRHIFRKVVVWPGCNDVAMRLSSFDVALSSATRPAIGRFRGYVVPEPGPRRARAVGTPEEFRFLC